MSTAQKNIITIHISESGTIKNKQNKTAIISAIVVPFNHRKEVKQEIKTAIEKGGVDPEKRVIKWTKVSPKEQHIYMNILTALNKDELVRYYAVKVRNFDYYKLIPAYLQLIQAVKKDFPEAHIRVFIQKNEQDKYNKLSTLTKVLSDKGITTDVNQAPLKESRFIQCADLIGGAVLFFTRDDMYLEKMGKPGKATVVEHGLNIKKKPKKINVIDYKEVRRIF